MKLELTSVLKNKKNCCRILIIDSEGLTTKHKTSQKPRISIVTCFNDIEILEVNLLASLLRQDELFELVLVDNTKARFKSLPVALNFGGSKSLGEYILFVHQDVYLQGEDWLRNAYYILKTLSDVGAAGVSGVSPNGEFKGFIVDRGRYWGKPIRKPMPVRTLDEQLIIIPRRIFNTIKFDEHFKFHSYVADYCLTLQEKRYKVYVLPLSVEHNSVTVGTLKASSIEMEDRLLYLKHRPMFKVICKTTGDLGNGLYKIRRNLASMLSNLYLKIVKCIIEFLGGHFTGKILDLGCVPAEQMYLKKLLKKEYSVGVSDKKRYLLVSKRLKVHDDYVIAQLSKLPFHEQSFDVTVLFSTLEYLPKDRANTVISAAEKVGKKVIVKVPYLCSPLFLPILSNEDRACSIFCSCWGNKDFQKRDYKTCTFGVKILTPVLLFAVR